jgi:hypothetical protein
VVAMLTLGTGVICHQLNYLLLGPRTSLGWVESVLQRLMESKLLVYAGGSLFAAALLALVFLGPITTTTSLVTLVLVLVCGATTVLLGAMVRVIWAVMAKQKALLGEEFKAVATVLPSPVHQPVVNSPTAPAPFAQPAGLVSLGGQQRILGDA